MNTPTKIIGRPKRGSIRETYQREFRIWKTMKARCYNPNNKRYPWYGAKGIIVCQRWKSSFANFIADMGQAPPGHSIERKRVAGNYEPDNCEWIPLADQRFNRTDSALLTAWGETKNHCLWEMDSRCVVSRTTFRTRIAKGWTPEAALSTPPTNFSVAGKRARGIPKPRRQKTAGL